MFFLVFLGLWNQVLSFVVWIPADSVQESKAVSNGHTDFGPKLNSSLRLADIAALSALREIGVEGAIVGKALYAGAFTLEEALELTKK